jgi:peptidoglycan hydrolase CwlO-like protein
MRGALRWVLVALLAFGLGVLLIAFALYVPTRQKLDKANADLEHANATITGKTDQITTLQTGNENLQKKLDSATLHMYVLEALSGVRGASLAVAANDYAGARLSLIQASEALDTLSGLLGTDQKDVLTAMQQSAVQALTEVKTDLKSAQPELDQLTKNLVQLQDNLFPNP